MRKRLLILFFAVYIAISLIGCGNSEKNTADINNKNDAAEDNQPDQTKTERDDKPEETAPTSEEDSENTTENSTTEQLTESEENFTEEKTAIPELVDGMRQEFKAAMDSYEEFFDEYCEFMKKYSESDNITGMLSDYMDYITKYTDVMEKLDKIGEEELNSTELKYYTEVMGRINQKLLEASSY